jgi:hypothetical protein
VNAQQLAARLAASRKPVAFGPCTAKTQRCPDSRDYTVELRPCCRAHLIALMAQAAAVLNILRVVWWADYGTLMGAVRNPMTTWADYPWLPQEGRTTAGPAAGIVPHDKDADLGVESRSYDAVLRGLRGHGGQVKALSGHSLKLELSARNQTNVDLFFWNERPDGTLYRDRYASVDQFKGKEFHRDLLFPLTTVEWEGMTLPAPRDPEAFLAMRYGPNWRTPVAANNDGVRR